MPYGYTGKILHVDLTSGTLTTEEPDESFYRTYMGGSAMGMHYVLKDCPAGADPLGEENVLALFTGILTGTPISGQSRLTSVARSPLTNAIGDAQGGGFFPAELKLAGYDGIVVRGKSPKPVYLWIHHGEAELRDASHLWGKITGEAEQQIRDELEDKRIEVLQIGPSGEKMVRYAALISMSNRANGRTGMGAVMGSKMLKAIAVRGKQNPGIADPDAFKALHFAAEQGSATAAAILVERMAVVQQTDAESIVSCLHAPNSRGDGALARAAARGHVAVVKLLVQAHKSDPATGEKR